MPRKCYRVLRNGTLIKTPLAPLYAGVRTRKRFCWPECRHVAGAKRRNRVFFLT